MRLGFAPRLAFANAVALVILGVVAWGAVRGTLRWQEHAVEVERTHEMLARLHRLLSAVVDVETGTRGFALTGDESFLEPYRKGTSRIDVDLPGLEELAIQDPRLGSGLGDLRALVAERVRLAGRLVELRRNEGAEAAGREVASARGKQIQDRIRSQVAEIERTEKEQLRVRTEGMRAWSRTTRATVAASGLLALAVAGSALGLVRRELRARHRAEAALREARDGLERTVGERTTELARTNRALRTIDEARHAVIRAGSENELLERICRVVVELGGYRLAWVGFAEPDEARTVRAVAHFGFEDGYLDRMQLTYADTERGRGPTGTAIRSGQPCVCNDLAADPRFAPWREEAVKRGYAASLVLPLGSSEGVLGVLNVYSERRGAFDEEEQAMLGGLANDLGHGLSALRERQRRQDAEARTREQERRFRHLFEQAGDAILLISDRNRILEANSAAVELTGYPRESLVGLEVAGLLDPGEWGRLEVEPAAMMAGQPHLAEWVHRRRDGSLFVAEVSARRLDDASYLAILRDLTERRRTLEALRASEERLRLALEAARMGTFEWDLRQDRLRWSRGHEALWGYADGEFPGTYEAFAARILPEDVRALELAVQTCQSARTRFAHEFRVVWPEGSLHWIAAAGEFDFGEDGRATRMRGVVWEVTDRKRIERELRELSSRLLRVQDEERRRLARELHDTTSQNLAVLGLTLGRLRSVVAFAGTTAEKWVVESRELAGLVAREIRTFSYLLHPPMLDLVGLPGALREYLGGFRQRGGLSVETEIEDGFGRLAPEIETSLFRVVQEGLGNIHRHSGSPTARLRLRRENGAVILELLDAGKGIPADRLRELQTGIVGVGVGIAGMRERLAQFGGRLEIHSGPEGTALRAVVPIDPRT